MQKIMVFRFSAMGDVAMTVPVIKTLLDQHPDVEIIMVSRPFFQPIFENLSRVKFLGVNLNKDYKGLSGLFKLFNFLRQEKPDAIADLHDVLRTKVIRNLFRLSGYKIAVIDKGRKEKKALTRPKNKVFKALKTTHERYADVFRTLGLTVNLQKFKPLPINIPSSVSLFLQNFEGQKIIGIAPYAAHKGKQYPLDKITSVIRLILKESLDTNIVLLGSPAEKKSLDVLEAIDRNRVVNIAGIFSFSEELALISKLNAMFSMDSGNAHLAALYGVPVVNVWGATHPHAGFAPFGQDKKLQLIADRIKYPQLPTSVYGNKTFEGFDNIWESIAPEKVAKTLLNIL